MDPNTGEITGSVNGVLANTTYTVTATHGSSGSGSGPPFVNNSGALGNAGSSYTKIAVDSNGYKHIVYMRQNVGTIYATDTSGSWVNTTSFHTTEVGL